MRIFVALFAVAGFACASQPPPEESAAKPPPKKRRPRPIGFGSKSAGKPELEAAIAAAKRNDLETTITQCRAAIEKNPNLEQAYLLLGSACSLNDDADCERQAYADGMAALPTSVALHAEAGFLALQEGRNADAVANYERARGLTDGKNSDVLAHLAYAKGLGGDMKAALDLAKQASADDKCGRCAAIHGRLLLASKDVPGAITQLERAHRITPDDLDAASQLAKAYYLGGRVDDALSTYAKLVEATKDPSLTSEYAIVLMKAKRYKEAATQLDTLTQAFPKEKSLWERLYEAQKKAGDKKGARQTKKKLEAM
ncbi:MAG: tetratricopeptide repeat protein [Deltaproteobacteria bacterium]